jgi:hypothetical protein
MTRTPGAGADARGAEAGSDLEGIRGEDGVGGGTALRSQKTPGAQGCLRSAAASKPKKSRKATTFVPVRVVPASAVPSSAPPTCRLLHPVGWVLECDGLPPASWVAAVLNGGAHAAS